MKPSDCNGVIGFQRLLQTERLIQSTSIGVWNRLQPQRREGEVVRQQVPRQVVMDVVAEVTGGEVCFGKECFFDETFTASPSQRSRLRRQVA